MMEKVIKRIAKAILLDYGFYKIQVTKNRLKRLINPKIENKYLIILSPPYCGSTLLNEIICTSPSVSVNNNIGTREGQTLPGVRKVMFDNAKRWDASVDFEWEYIKKEWRKYWDVTRPILLEKSPPNLLRSNSIRKVFPNSYFIILYRNPYAQCESLIRRNSTPAKIAARFAIKCLRYQKKNIASLSNSIVISYESLTEKPKAFASKIITLLPELLSIDVDKNFSSHNFLNEKIMIRNLNDEKVNNLNEQQLEEINTIFYKEKEILDYFNYNLIESNTK